MCSNFYSESEKVTFEDFFRWVETENNAESLGLSRWLLYPNPNLSLVNKTDTPTFYQTLAGVTHLEELEVVELEKRFWELAGHSASNQIDLVTISPMISPPLPATVAAPFFEALDENEDGHIDFKELSCGMSAACRGPEMERQKCEIYLLTLKLLNVFFIKYFKQKEKASNHKLKAVLDKLFHQIFIDNLKSDFFTQGIS